MIVTNMLSDNIVAAMSLPTTQSIPNHKSVMSESTHPSIEAILFDLDGTLLDTERLSDEAMLYALFGFTRENKSEDELLLPWPLKRSILGLRGSEWAPMVINYYKEHKIEGHEMNNITAKELWEQWESRLNYLCENVKACPGAGELVEALSQVPGMKIAIATSSQKEAVETKKKHHMNTIFKHMNLIVTGDDPELNRGKPAPDIYLLAAKRLGVNPRNCLVFEDAMSGVIAARAAGCQVVAVPDPRMNKEEFSSKADTVLESLSLFELDHFGL